MEANDRRGGGFVDLGGKYSKLSKNGCGEVGGVAKSSMGSSFGDSGGDGDLGGCDGAGSGVVAIGVLVGDGVVTMIGDFGGGVGVLKLGSFHLGWVMRS